MTKRKDGTTVEKLGKKKFEVQTFEKMGDDGVMEDHMVYHTTNKKRQMHIHGTPKCRNVMSNEDRKRMGLPIDRGQKR